MKTRSDSAPAVRTRSRAGRLPVVEEPPGAARAAFGESEETPTLIEQTVAQERMEAAAAAHPDRELFTINFGPHHPSTHGVLRVLATIEGEVMQEVVPIIGYLHTGIEKNCEDKPYWKVIPLIERTDYCAYYFNALAYCHAVERLLEIEIPPRARYLRVIHLELSRIFSHLVWLGTSVVDLGAMSPLFYAFRERESVTDIMEMSSGQRMHTRYFQVGGVMEDIPIGFEEKVLEFCETMPKRVDEYLAILQMNQIVIGRLKGVGAIPKERLLELGVTGPLLRAAGVAWDLRKRAPYEAYGDFEFDVPVGTVGDAYDRFLVRTSEIYESVKIIEQAIRGIPEGPFMTGDRKVALPPRNELATSMESLIHHFKLVTEGFRVPEGEVYAAIESPRGELGCFVVSDGSSKPVRVHLRDPSFVHMQSISDMCRGEYVADFIATLAMLDPILGGVDR